MMGVSPSCCVVGCCLLLCCCAVCRVSCVVCCGEGGATRMDGGWQVADGMADSRRVADGY